MNVEDLVRVGSNKTRLIRHLVHQHRKLKISPTATLQQWPKLQLQCSEEVFAHQDEASAIFNSSLAYEIPVLKVIVCVCCMYWSIFDPRHEHKVYAEPLLRKVTPESPEYAVARLLLRFLGNFETLPVTVVPQQSVLKDFL